MKLPVDELVPGGQRQSLLDLLFLTSSAWFGLQKLSIKAFLIAFGTNPGSRT